MPKSSAGSVVIFAVAGGAGLLIYSGLTGINLSDAIMGKGGPLNPKGGAPIVPQATTTTDFGADPTVSQAHSSGQGTNSQGDSSASGTASGPHNVVPATTGSPIVGQAPHASDHQTLGLPGYPAHDYFAKAGTPVVSPVSGTVVKLSGKDPRLGGLPGGPLGYSVYVQGGGKTYYMTHMDKVLVKKGQQVTQGQQIAQVANGPISWAPTHVHMGIRTDSSPNEAP